RAIEGTRGMIVQAWSVDESDLRSRQIHDPEDAVARGLRTRRDDAHLLSDQGVEQGRFADVRPADQGSEPAAEAFCHGVSMSFRIRSAASCSARLRLRPLPCARRPRSATSQITWKVCA